MKVLTVIAAAVLATALTGTAPAAAHGKPGHDKCKRDSVGVVICCHQEGREMHCMPRRTEPVPRRMPRHCYAVPGVTGIKVCVLPDGTPQFWRTGTVRVSSGTR